MSGGWHVTSLCGLQRRGVQVGYNRIEEQGVAGRRCLTLLRWLFGLDLGDDADGVFAVDRLAARDVHGQNAADEGEGAAGSAETLDFDE